VDTQKPLSVNDNNLDESDKELYQTQTFPMIYTPPDSNNYSPFEISHAFKVSTIDVGIDGGVGMCVLEVGKDDVSSVVQVLGAALPDGNTDHPFSAANLAWDSVPKDIAEVDVDKTDRTNATIKALNKGITTVGVSFGNTAELLGYVLVQVRPKSDSDESANQVDDLAGITERLESVIKPEEGKTYTENQKESVKAVANETVELPDSAKAELTAEYVGKLETLMNEVCGAKPTIEKPDPKEVAMEVTGVAVATVEKVYDVQADTQQVMLKVTTVPPTDAKAKMQLSVELSMGEEKIQPDSPLFFTLTLPDGLDPDYLELLHIKDSGEVETLDVKTVDKAQRIISFKMTSLSQLQSVPTNVPTEPDESEWGGGGSSGKAGFRIFVEGTEHGIVNPNRTSASFGTTVFLTAKPDKDCELKSISVTDATRSPVRLTTVGDYSYSFVMSDKNVTVSAWKK